MKKVSGSAAALTVAPTGRPVHVGMNPDMLHADGLDDASPSKPSGSDAALVQELQGSLWAGGAADPVLHFVDRDFYGAELIAGGDVSAAQ